MTFSQNWHFSDIFTVNQAAALWCCIEPASFDILHPVDKHPEAAAIQHFIISELRAARTASGDSNAIHLLPWHSHAVVSRQWLMELATSKGVRPTFLFDTLLPDQAPNESASDDVKVTENAKTKNKGGRPPEHDWDACIIEIIRTANTPDGLPESQAELVRQLSEWFSKTYNNEPAESSIKSRVSRIYGILGISRKPSEG